MLNLHATNRCVLSEVLAVRVSGHRSMRAGTYDIAVRVQAPQSTGVGTYEYGSVDLRVRV